MFITRASRRDRTELQEFYDSQDWGEVGVDQGVAFFARQGGIVGAIRLVEAEPNVLMVEDVVVQEELRGGGIGRALMQAAMNSRGGKLYLCTHSDSVGFYEKFGFAAVDYDTLPETVRARIEHEGDAPHQIEEGHVHIFMTAR